MQGGRAAGAAVLALPEKLVMAGNAGGPPVKTLGGAGPRARRRGLAAPDRPEKVRQVEQATQERREPKTEGGVTAALMVTVERPAVVTG